jgi:hypothetical protein
MAPINIRTPTLEVRDLVDNNFELDTSPSRGIYLERPTRPRTARKTRKSLYGKQEIDDSPPRALLEDISPIKKTLGSPPRENVESIVESLLYVDMPTVKQMVKLVSLLKIEKQYNDVLSFSTKVFSKLQIRIAPGKIELPKIYLYDSYKHLGHGSQLLRVLIIASIILHKRFSVIDVITPEGRALCESFVQKGLLLLNPKSSHGDTISLEYDTPFSIQKILSKDPVQFWL